MPDIFKAIGAARFGVMAGVAAALTAFFLYVAGVIAEPPKSVLFAGLDPRDAAAVTAKLDTMQVQYDAKGDGGTILVPTDQVTKLRMELASENLPAAGVGYEIFDKSDAFGTTSFVQNINSLRALEGELARSIQTIDGIEAARVHLVIPERQIFSHDQQTPSASVVLRTGGTLGHGQVLAIQHLVAAAAAGMSPDRVAIIDDKGDLLAGGDDKSGGDATGAEEESQTSDFEDRMRQRIESIVASIVGVGHVRVQVAANIDYKHISETSDLFDPDGKVIRSTQTTERNANESAQQSGGGNSVSVSNAVPTAQTATTGSGDPGKKSDSTSTEETTNYEISHTQRVSTTDGGQLKRLSVAVVVDGTSVTDANGKTAYTPRSKPDMAQITQLVQSAIGYDKSRGDQVEVTNMQFARLDDGPATPAPQPLLGLDGAYWFKIIEAAILSITALLIGFFIVRPLIKRMFAPVPTGLMVTTTQIAGALPAPTAQSDGMQQAAAPAPLVIPPPRESMIDIQRIDGQVRDSAIKKVGEVVQAHPEEALAILRSWLHQPV